MPKSQCNVAITGPMLYDVKACVICPKFATFVTTLNQLIIISNNVSVEALVAKCLNAPFTSKVMSRFYSSLVNVVISMQQKSGHHVKRI